LLGNGQIKIAEAIDFEQGLPKLRTNLPIRLQDIHVGAGIPETVVGIASTNRHLSNPSPMFLGTTDFSPALVIYKNILFKKTVESLLIIG